MDLLNVVARIETHNFFWHDALRTLVNHQLRLSRFYHLKHLYTHLIDIIIIVGVKKGRTAYFIYAKLKENYWIICKPN